MQGRALATPHGLKLVNNVVDPVALTQALVRLDSVNPPGNEVACAKLVGGILADAGFDVHYSAMASDRACVVAVRRNPADPQPCLAFTGHLDTVPLGTAPWAFDPFGGQIEGGRLYGRGSSDMKSGVAAMVAAALRCAPWLAQTAGLALVLTAGEETGCDGARHLERVGALPSRVGALVVGEPTANQPKLGHKGALWVHACTHGRTAHGSMPEQGDNAIYKLARVVLALEKYALGKGSDSVFGKATLNVGTIAGGININSVPDRALIGIDIRTVPGLHHDELEARLERHLGGTVELRRLLDAPGVYTDGGDAWVRRVCDLVARVVPELAVASAQPGVVPYFTDASVLKAAFGNVPTVILGPGEPHMAHQTDEYASVARIHEATEIYEALIRQWCGRLEDASSTFPQPAQEKPCQT